MQRPIWNMNTLRPGSAGAELQVRILVCLALMAATYLAFTIRTMIDPVDPGELLSGKRAMASAAGAAMCWFAVQRIRMIPLAELPTRLIGIACIVVAGGGFVLATRIAYDFAIEGETQALLARNLRWVITWLGYFAAAVMGYLAITFARSVSEARKVSKSASASLQAPSETQAAFYEEADPILTGQRDGS